MYLDCNRKEFIEFNYKLNKSDKQFVCKICDNNNDIFPNWKKLVKHLLHPNSSNLLLKVHPSKVESTPQVLQQAILSSKDLNKKNKKNLFTFKTQSIIKINQIF